MAKALACGTRYAGSIPAEPTFLIFSGEWIFHQKAYPIWIGFFFNCLELKPGTIRRTTRGKKMKMVKDAVTEYHSLEYFEQSGETFTFVELFPKTGRTHQLRVHMASIHHSVVGDVMYGRKENPFNIKHHFLHAQAIEFSSKSGGQQFRFEAPLPPHLQTVLRKLKKTRI